MTLNPISSGHTSQAAHAVPATGPKLNQPQTNQGGGLQKDTVTLSHATPQGAATPKSSGDLNHDGDGH